METKFKSALTTLELSNEEGLTSIKLSQNVLKETILEVKLSKATVGKVIDALKKLSE
jgi:hypothetical protein